MGTTQRQRLINRTTLNVTLKTLFTTLLAWITDLKSGSPSRGDWEIHRLRASAEATSDADGIAGDLIRRDNRGAVGVPDSDGGFGSHRRDDGVGPWDFGVKGDNRMVVSHGPIYRPARQSTGSAIGRRGCIYSLPAAKSSP
jgi:hypothetical protein